MELTVAICDDSPEQIELLRGYLQRLAGGSGLTIVSSADPEEFLLALQRNRPDLVFLDIDMGAWNGIQLGERIKEEYAAAVIVYVTAYEAYALEAFRVRAFHYLLKPVTEEQFQRVFQEAAAFLRAFLRKKGAEESAPKFLVIHRKDETIYCNYDDIDYFEKVGHKIKVHAGNRDIDYYGNFIRLLDALEPDFFLKCHQGYIVNKSKIRRYRDKTLFLEGNIAIPVSRSYLPAVHEMLTRRLFAGAGES